jgi:hypothetical protein
MSTTWTITCKGCGHQETIRTPRTSDGMSGEQSMAEHKAKEPCPKCKSTQRELGH